MKKSYVVTYERKVYKHVTVYADSKEDAVAFSDHCPECDGKIDHSDGWELFDVCVNSKCMEWEED